MCSIECSYIYRAQPWSHTVNVTLKIPSSHEGAFVSSIVPVGDGEVGGTDQQTPRLLVPQELITT